MKMEDFRHNQKFTCSTFEADWVHFDQKKGVDQRNDVTKINIQNSS